MAASDYIIKFTDPNNGSFVIKPYTTNGPASPTSVTPLDPSAVSANTSIVLVGKGMDQYGQRVETSIVNMLEHFASPLPPVYPIQGQLWFKNDTIELRLFDGTVSDWSSSYSVVINGHLAEDLDVNGHKIINVATPTVPTDGANAAYVNTRVLRSGDTMTGFLTLNADPTDPLHAATKQYVDTAVADGVSGAVTSFNTRTGAVTLLSSDVTTALGYTPVNQAGDTMTGFLTLASDPIDPMHAATKNYVDTQSVSSLNGLTGTVTLTAVDIDNILGYTPVNRAGDTMTGYLTLFGSPIADAHAATKQYVDLAVANATTGTQLKMSVRAASTGANIDLTTGGLITLDGVVLQDGDRVLVKNQTNPVENGIYEAAPSTWNRSIDADSSPPGEKITSATFVFVEEGTTNGSSGWVVSSPNPISVDVDPIYWVRFSVDNSTPYLPLSGGTMTGTVNLATYTESYSAATVSNSVTLNVATATVFNETLTANVTSFGFTGAIVSGKAFSITILLTQGGTGGYTVTWPASIKWPNGVAPTLTTAVGKVDIISLMTVNGGTTWYGNYSQNF